MHEHADHPQTKTYFIVFAILLALMFATIAAAQVHLGFWNFPVALAIATAKAALIMLFFMHVYYSRPLIGLVAAASFFWLAILFGLTLSDYFTRTQALPPSLENTAASEAPAQA